MFETKVVRFKEGHNNQKYHWFFDLG